MYPRNSACFSTLYVVLWNPCCQEILLMYSSPWNCPQSNVKKNLGFFLYFISPVHISATGDSFRLMDRLSACHFRFVIPLQESLEAWVPLSTVQSTERFCTMCPHEATSRQMEVQSVKINVSIFPTSYWYTGFVVDLSVRKNSAFR